MAIPDDVLRTALEEYIAFGPATRRPAEERLRARLPADAGALADEALAEARAAVAAAEQLAREYEARRRSQRSCAQELARRFPWLGGDAGGDLALRLAHFGYYLVIK